jgi:hypothetical protein
MAREERSTQQRPAPEVDIDSLQKKLGDVGSLLVSIRDLGSAVVDVYGAEGVAIEAMSEKAGALVDECLEAIGSAPNVGTWKEWAEMKIGSDERAAWLQSARKAHRERNAR